MGGASVGDGSYNRPMNMPGRVGPYEILDVLGRGGMGVVYQGKHEVTGRPAAVKTVSIDEEPMVESIRREIQALARVRHPGIVRIVDEGVDQGFPWYAMEVVEGPRLDVWWRERWSWSEQNRHEVLPELLGVVRRLCITLSFLHGEGLVHRDLKPSNILITEAGQPVLMDFGVAADIRMGTTREALVDEPTNIGTHLYTTPEQIRGEPGDARSDLYALGCILYELLSGGPAFTGETVGAVLQGHLKHDPEPLTGKVAGVSVELDRLVADLLQKDVAERIGFADTVAHRLLELGADPEEPLPTPEPRAYLYRPSLVGRDREVAELEQAMVALDAGLGGLTLISGSSGVGKTRLARELVRKARRKGVLVLLGEAHHTLFRTPLAPLRRPLQTIAERCESRGPEETAWILGSRRAVLARYVPALRELPGPSEEEVPLAEEHSRVRLFQYLTKTLEALATYQPLVLVLDDLQWADALTIGWLRHLANAQALEHPVLVVGLRRQRSDDPELLPEAVEPSRIHLETLDQKHLAEMIEQMLATPVASPLTESLLRTADGNPFLVTEHLRAAVDEGLLARQDGDWWVRSPEGTRLVEWTQALPLPVTMTSLLGSRLSQLPAAALGLAELAAVLGADLDAQLLQQVAEITDRGVWSSLSELMRREILVEPGPGRLRFKHQRLRSHVYEQIPAPRRRSLHRTAALALERIYSGDDSKESSLGTHWDQAGEPARARACYRRAASIAASQHGLEEAGKLLRAYLTLNVRPSLESVRVRVELAQILAKRGTPAPALAELDRAVREAQELGDRPTVGEALRRAGGLLADIGSWPEALDSLSRAATILESEGDQAALSEVYSLLAFIHLEQGRRPEAAELYERSLAGARACGKPEAVARTLGYYGRFLHLIGDPRGARRSWEESLEIDRALGDRVSEAKHLSSLAGLDREQGRIAEARGAYEQALTIFREIGDRPQEEIALGNLAILEITEGHRETAMRLYGDALRVARQTGNRRREGIDLGNMACLLLDEGQYEDAERYLNDALTIAREVGARRFEGQVLGNMGTLYLQAESWEQAADAFGSALAIHQEVGNLRSQSIVEANLGNLRRKQGRFDEAERLYRSALTICEKQGEDLRTANVIGNMATLERQRGRLNAARELSERALEICRRMGDHQELVKQLCERGHLALAMGEDVQSWWTEARRIATDHWTGTQGEVARALTRLERATLAAAQEEELVHGECREDAPSSH